MKYAKKMERILEVLSSDEPDYSSISDLLSEENYSALDELISNAPIYVATKAIICLGLVGSEKSINSIAIAANNDNPVLRIAAAQALSNLKGDKTNLVAVQTINKLLDDKDIGVKKFALKTVGASQMFALKEKVQKIFTDEKNEGLRKLAQSVLKELGLNK